MNLREFIRDVPDFPKPGIIFKDITPLLSSPAAFRCCIDQMAEPHRHAGITHLAAAEARGFIFAAPLALTLSAAFVPIRKPGKLPAETDCLEYGLEYGTDTVELHVDALGQGSRVLMIDDVLATGGTMAACCTLVENQGATVVGCSFLIELAFLNGREKLTKYNLHALLCYD